MAIDVKGASLESGSNETNEGKKSQPKIRVVSFWILFSSLPSLLIFFLLLFLPSVPFSSALVNVDTNQKWIRHSYFLVLIICIDRSTRHIGF